MEGALASAAAAGGPGAVGEPRPRPALSPQHVAALILPPTGLQELLTLVATPLLCAPCPPYAHAQKEDLSLSVCWEVSTNLHVP